MARLARAEFVHEGVDAAVAALEACGIAVSAVRPGDVLDAVLDVIVDDRPFSMSVEVKAYCTGDVAGGLIRRPQPHGGVFPLLVAERITAEAGALLSDAGWSWLDRRGRLHLRAPAVRVDIDVPASPGVEQKHPRPAIAGRSGVVVAYWQLDHPDEALSPNRHAHELRLAPSTISTTVRRLLEAGLIGDDRRAQIPELFWELATVWHAKRTWLVDLPGQANRSPDPHAATWRRTGTAAAAAWGAPVVSGEGGPVELYVPGPVEVSIAVRRYGAAEPGAGRAVLAPAPTPAVVAGPHETGPVPTVDGWPVAPRLAVALDLAQDKARGREILDAWDVADAVWR